MMSNNNNNKTKITKSFSVIRLNNNIININKPMEFEAFTDRELLFVASLV